MLNQFVKERMHEAFEIPKIPRGEAKLQIFYFD